MPSAELRVPPAVSSASVIGGAVCAGCGTELASTLLRCPACRRLVHADDLARLASEAERHEAAGQPGAALVVWRQALELLPDDAAQAATIQQRIGALGAAAGDADGSPPPPNFAKRF